jgi:hypothetical protein
MKINLKLIGLLSLIILLASCEGNTDRVRQVRNNTSGNIQVSANGSMLTNFNKTISINQTEILYIGNQLGGTDYVEYPANGIATMVITNASGDTCTKDFTIQANWDISVEQRKKIPSDWLHEYTFIVEDSDF